jgi:hypothetical protein
LYQLNHPCGPSSFFGLVRFTPAQLVSSPPFSLPGATSPLANVITPSRHVMLPFHWAKTSSLPPLHFTATLYTVASPLKPKLKQWIRTTVIGYPPWTAWLPPSTALKRSSKPWSLHTTQPCLYFASSLAKALCHQSSTHLRRSLLPQSHTHCPSAQWHLWWQTSRPYFASRIAYRHMNSRKKIFWNAAAWCGVINYSLHPHIFDVCSTNRKDPKCLTSSLILVQTLSLLTNLLFSLLILSFCKTDRVATIVRPMDPPPVRGTGGGAIVGHGRRSRRQLE